jgi:hypothetical protein
MRESDQHAVFSSGAVPRMTPVHVSTGVAEEAAGARGGALYCIRPWNQMRESDQHVVYCTGAVPHYPVHVSTGVAEDAAGCLTRCVSL